MNTLKAFSTEQLATDLRAALVRPYEAKSFVLFYATLQALFSDNVLIRYDLSNNARTLLDTWRITVYTPEHAVSVSGPLASPYLLEYDYAQHMARKLAQQLGECVFLRDGCEDD